MRRHFTFNRLAGLTLSLMFIAISAGPFFSQLNPFT